MRKVLIILPFLQAGGTERVNVQIMRSLTQRGYQTRLFLVNHEIITWDDGLDDLSIIWGLEQDESRLWHLKKLLQALLREARQADVIIGGMELTSTYLAAWASMISRRPSVGWVHIDLDDFPAAHDTVHRLVSRCLYPQLQAVVAVSKGTARAAGRFVPAIRERLRVIYNPVDIEAVRRKAGEYTGSDNKVPVVAGLGRLVPQKGFDILIRAHHLLLQRNIEHRLLIIGEGPERSSLESLAAALGVADTVDMPGFQSNPFPSLQQADIFAFPSRFEGLGLALVEAMALGKPVVSCDCPSGPAEILQQGESGILVPTDDPVAMADALKQLLGSSELRTAMGSKAWQRAEDFRPDIATDQIEELLNSII